jgi:phosphatidylserine decarboxylase
MAKPLPLPVWDRRSGTSFSEWMDDHTPTYETQPHRSVTQWIKSQPVYDRLDAAYRNTRWSARQIEPFVRKYHIDMSEFEPVEYRSIRGVFRPTIPPGGS